MQLDCRSSTSIGILTFLIHNLIVMLISFLNSWHYFVCRSSFMYNGVIVKKITRIANAYLSHSYPSPLETLGYRATAKLLAKIKKSVESICLPDELDELFSSIAVLSFV